MVCMVYFYVQNFFLQKDGTEENRKQDAKLGDIKIQSSSKLKTEEEINS